MTDLADRVAAALNPNIERGCQSKWLVELIRDLWARVLELERRMKAAGWKVDEDQRAGAAGADSASQKPDEVGEDVAATGPALVERLRSFATAYPESIFGPVTEQEIKDHASLITRNSAAMGRHCAKFMSEAADRIEALEKMNKGLSKSAVSQIWQEAAQEDSEIDRLRAELAELTEGKK